MSYLGQVVECAGILQPGRQADKLAAQVLTGLLHWQRSASRLKRQQYKRLTFCNFNLF